MNELNEDILLNLFSERTVVFLPTCHSTNTVAHSKVADGQLKSGDLVLSPNQTNGKGQRGNTWLSEANKNLTFSYIFESSKIISLEQMFFLNMMVSLTLKSIVGELVKNEHSVKIKWPNDICIKSKKVAGILIENKINHKDHFLSVIGIGLNVNQLEFGRLNATSIYRETKVIQNLNNLVFKLINELEKTLNKYSIKEYNTLYVNYLYNLYLFNEWHFFKSSEIHFEGKIIGISSLGKLQIITKENELKEFGMQEVSFI